MVKSPNSDGFSFSFIRFHSFGSYFVTLILNIKSPDQISNFKPISLVGSLLS